MDWIERLLGVSPDHGDHSLEIFLVIAVACIFVALLIPRSRRYRRGFDTQNTI
jgi:hypothetical protein